MLGGLAVGAASVLAPAYISEVAPAKYRGRLSSIQQIAIITITFSMMLSGIGLGGAYSIYVGCALISLFLVMKCVRETKGLELEDMKG